MNPLRLRLYPEGFLRELQLPAAHLRDEQDKSESVTFTVASSALSEAGARLGDSPQHNTRDSHQANVAAALVAAAVTGQLGVGSAA